ncbi:hypothetical protein RNP52_25795, partial [Escherichia coli]|nr:hypothetical protein [Escherichia coli]
NGSVKVTRTDLHRCYSPISFTVIRSYWNSGVLAAPDNHLTHEERSALQKLWGGLETGDVTIIGRSDEVHDFTSALINCFLSEEEIVWWQSGGIFPDPWPANISRLN